MTAISLHTQQVRKMASRLGVTRGYRILRVHLNDKRPVDAGWPERATNDVDVIEEWFPQHGTEYNIGVACGPQPNGINLVVVDVDVNHEGLTRWADLLRINGHPDTAMHATPSGGLHVFFDCPFPLNNSGALGAGIDVRDAGGQVVIPPSIRDDGRYEAVGQRGLAEYTVETMPEWLQALLRPTERRERTVAASRHPSNGLRAADEPLGNADWLRDHWDWVDELVKAGYSVVRQAGDRVFLAHPTATSEWSCTVDLADGRMNAYSTNMPSALREAQINRDGSVSWSPYDWFVATEHDGDYSSATRELNRRRAPLAVTGQRATEPPLAESDATSAWRMPGVDPAYWSASARNAHILAAARAAMVSPDALDLVVFALESLLIPPGYLLPTIVGAPQPLNFLACLVANTGLFKSATLGAARDLMGPFPPWVTQIGMGSGEGIGATFLKEGTEASPTSGKQVKTGQLVRNDVRAAFFEADEGSGLTEMARRSGATIIANLCKAWTGSTLGEANADPAKRRHVLHNDYRIAALVNIQPAAFEALFSEANTGVGLTGRFMFSGTLDPEIPDVEPPWPGLLAHPTLPQAPVTLEIEPSIVAAAKAEIRRRHRSGGLDTTVDAIAQNAAVIARMAGIACLVDDRRRITIDDWATATLRAEASASCLSVLTEWNRTRVREARHTQAAARAEAEIVVEDVKERRGVASMAENIRRHVADAPMAVGALRKAVAKSGLRHRFEPALDLAKANGWVAVDNGRVSKA